MRELAVCSLGLSDLARRRTGLADSQGSARQGSVSLADGLDARLGDGGAPGLDLAGGSTPRHTLQAGRAGPYSSKGRCRSGQADAKTPNGSLPFQFPAALFGAMGSPSAPVLGYLWNSPEPGAVTQARPDDAETEGWRCCTVCRIQKPIGEFHRKSAFRLGVSNRHSECKPCRAERKREYLARRRAEGRPYSGSRVAEGKRRGPVRDLLDERIASKVQGAKKRAAEKGWPFTLTVADVRAQWAKQGGRCAYTGRPMDVHGSSGPDVFSLDRVDSRLGYTADNLVLATHHANTAKLDKTLPEFLALCRDVLARAECPVV